MMNDEDDPYIIDLSIDPYLKACNILSALNAQLSQQHFQPRGIAYDPRRRALKTPGMGLPLPNKIADAIVGPLLSDLMFSFSTNQQLPKITEALNEYYTLESREVLHNNPQSAMNTYIEQCMMPLEDIDRLVWSTSVAAVPPPILSISTQPPPIPVMAAQPPPIPKLSGPPPIPSTVPPPIPSSIKTNPNDISSIVKTRPPEVQAMIQKFPRLKQLYDVEKYLALDSSAGDQALVAFTQEIITAKPFTQHIYTRFTQALLQHNNLKTLAISVECVEYALYLRIEAAYQSARSKFIQNQQQQQHQHQHQQQQQHQQQSLNNNMMYMGGFGQQRGPGGFMAQQQPPVQNRGWGQPVPSNTGWLAASQTNASMGWVGTTIAPPAPNKPMIPPPLPNKNIKDDKNKNNKNQKDSLQNEKINNEFISKFSTVQELDEFHNKQLAAWKRHFKVIYCFLKEVELIYAQTLYPQAPFNISSDNKPTPEEIAQITKEAFVASHNNTTFSLPKLIAQLLNLLTQAMSGTIYTIPHDITNLNIEDLVTYLVDTFHKRDDDEYPQVQTYQQNLKEYNDYVLASGFNDGNGLSNPPQPPSVSKDDIDLNRVFTSKVGQGDIKFDNKMHLSAFTYDLLLLLQHYQPVYNLLPPTLNAPMTTPILKTLTPTTTIAAFQSPLQSQPQIEPTELADTMSDVYEKAYKKELEKLNSIFIHNKAPVSQYRQRMYTHKQKKALTATHQSKRWLDRQNALKKVHDDQIRLRKEAEEIRIRKEQEEHEFQGGTEQPTAQTPTEASQMIPPPIPLAIPSMNDGELLTIAVESLVSTEEITMITESSQTTRPQTNAEQTPVTSATSTPPLSTTSPPPNLTDVPTLPNLPPLQAGLPTLHTPSTLPVLLPSPINATLHPPTFSTSFTIPSSDIANNTMSDETTPSQTVTQQERQVVMNSNVDQTIQHPHLQPEPTIIDATAPSRTQPTSMNDEEDELITTATDSVSTILIPPIEPVVPDSDLIVTRQQPLPQQLVIKQPSTLEQELPVELSIQEQSQPMTEPLIPIPQTNALEPVSAVVEQPAISHTSVIPEIATQHDNGDEEEEVAIW